MAYEAVKAQIDAYIKANGINLITGPVLNAVLTAMLDELGDGYAFQGVLTPSATPTPSADIPQAWLAAAGTYIGGAVTVDEGELALITHTADGWDKVTVYTGNMGDIPQPSDEDPLRDGTAEAGTSDDYARGDHRHPTDTSRAPVDNPEFNGKILIKDDEDDEVVEIGADGITRGGLMYAFPDNYGQLATTNETPFLATYGVTTYGDIFVAICAGRQVFAVYGNYRYQLEEARPGFAYKFTRTGDDGTVYCVAVSTNDVWSSGSVALAPKASPALTGTPTAPTAPEGTNTTQIATTAFVQKAVEGAGGGSDIDTVQVTVDNNTGTPSATGSVSGSTLSLDFHNLKGATGAAGAQGPTGPQGPQGPQGEQGNTGSSVDYPFELVNNLTTDDATKALSAAQGKVLSQEVTELEDKTDTTIEHNRNLADYASEINGYISSAGTFSAPSSGEKSIKFPCQPSTTYTISKVVTSRFRVAYFKNEPSAGVQGAGTITQHSASSITITTAADSTYIAAYVYNGSSESKTMEDIMASLQIEVGSTATEYVAPGWTAVDKIARGKNTTIEGRIGTIEESVLGNSEDISELQDAVLPSISGVDSAFVNTGKYRVITGELADSTAYFYTDPIRLYKGDKIVITSADIVASCSAISLLDANGDYVSTIYAGQGETASYTYTAQEDVLVELSALNSKMDCFAIDRNGILNRLSLDGGRIEVLENTIQDKTFGLDGVQVTTGAYRNSDGTISSLNGYYYTEPIKLHNGDSVFTDISIPTLSAVAYVTEVDSLGNFVSVLKAGSGEDETISVTIEKDCFVSISSVNSRRGNFFFTRNGLSTRMDILSEGGTEDTIDPATKLPAIGENPLSTIRRDAGYGSIIRKWGIIGDSLSSGEMQCYNEESTSSSDYKFIDMYQYSTGQVFARLIGAEAYNFSNGGQTTWGWLKSQGVVRDETYIGGVGGGDWRLAQQPEYIKDGYIIAMGVNDRVKIANGDYELGTTSQITTYNGTDSDIDDTTTYPKSFVRYYAGIIQRLLSVQPKAKIFCVTPLGDNYAEIAQAIRDIVTYFGGNVYLIDIRQYIPDGHNVAGFKLQGHLSPMGYAYWAYMFNTYIDWIIRNNGNAFRDTALIGTDYRPDYL